MAAFKKFGLSAMTICAVLLPAAVSSIQAPVFGEDSNAAQSTPNAAAPEKQTGTPSAAPQTAEPVAPAAVTSPKPDVKENAATDQTPAAPAVKTAKPEEKKTPAGYDQAVKLYN